MRRVGLLPLLAVLAALLSGCGGGASGASSSDNASGIVPGDALAFVVVDTDQGSTQFQNAKAIVDKFPIKDRALRSIRQSLAKQGVDLTKLGNSIGPELDIAALKVNGKNYAVGFTKPKDEQAFTAQLDSGTSKAKHEQVDGWTVFSNDQAAIAAVKSRTSNLGDEQAYKDALGTLPSDTIAHAYIAPAAFGQALATSGLGQAAPLDTSKLKWVAAAATADSGAVKVEVHAKGVQAPAAGSSELAGQIPAGSIVALNLVGASKAASGSAAQALQQAQTLLGGIDLQGLVGALGDDTIAYLKPGALIPEVTIASKPADKQRALAAVDGLIKRFAKPASPPSKVTVDGVELTKVDLGPVALFYGTFGDELVVSDNQNAVAELRSKSDRLTDDAVFKEARDGSGMPDSTQGFVYVNLKDGVPAAEALAQLASQKIPAEVDANLKPLRSLLVYGTRDGDVQNVVAYLQTS